MRITNNFAMAEFTFSQIASRKNLNNLPDSASADNIKVLCRNLLQPLRNLIDLPVIITSGFRCSELNEAVAGEPDSQHLTGKAADIIVAGADINRVFETIVKEFYFDQAILEYGKWIHLSYDHHNNRNRAMIAEMVNGKKRYRLYRAN